MVDFTPDQARALEALISDDAAELAGAETLLLADIPAHTLSDSITETVGPYRIVKTIGQGGMGEVFKARDDRLQRDVAIKAIRAERRPSRFARERFLQEARALSGLNHPGICHIFDYMETSHGDFLVLELIDGISLREAMRDGLDKPSRLRIAEQLTEALSAAHAAGVVHRDLKPENAMVTADGHIKVLDFGLAARRQSGFAGDGQGPDAHRAPDAPEEQTVAGPPTRSLWLTTDTEAGVVMGTPLYMSPEQARGESVTTASDIYSLGLLLQELFTGRSPIGEAFSVSELVEHARQAKSAPVRGIDRHLRQMIQSMKSAAPTDRPTAAEVVDRLRWVQGKPARRLRNGFIAAVLVVVLGGAVKYTIDLGYERTEAVEARNDAIEARNDAVDARNDAVDQIFFMLEELVEMEQVQRVAVLNTIGDQLLTYFEGRSPGDLRDRELFLLAKTHQMLGGVRMNEGDLTAAEQTFRQAIELGRAVVERDPANTEWLVELGASEFYLGDVFFERKEFDQTREQWKTYLDITEQVRDLEPSNPKWHMEIAFAHANLGALAKAEGKLDTAISETKRAIKLKRELVERDPDNAAWRGSLANSYSWLGSTYRANEQNDEAKAYFEDELDIRRDLYQRDKDNTDACKQLSTCLSYNGKFFQDQEQYDEALAHFRESRELARSIIASDPLNTRWQRVLAVAHRDVAGVLDDQENNIQAIEELRKARELLDVLVAKDPTNPDWRKQLIYTHLGLARVADELERWEDAIGEGQRVLTLVEPFQDIEVMDRSFRLWSYNGYRWQARAHAKQENAELARENWSAAADVIEPLAQNSADDRQRLAVALLHADRIDDARPHVLILFEDGINDEEFLKLAEDKGFDRPEPATKDD